MNTIGNYSVYQKNYYDNTTQKKEEKTGKSDKAEKARKKTDVNLSERAQKLLKELQKKYGNMDFIVANYETSEEAESYLSRGSKEYTVLLDPETLEAMAADEDVKNKYMNVIDEATGKLDDMKKQLGDDGDEVVRMGITVDKEGKVSYFAELEKMSEKTREYREKAAEKKKEEKAEEAKKAEKAEARERTKKTKVTADSVEELLEKIRNVDWDSIKAEEQAVAGTRYDFNV